MAKKLKVGETGKKPVFHGRIPAEVTDMPELTWEAIAIGVVLSVVFGAANAYLGLKVGLTVSASIPAAVIGMGVFRGILKRGTVLETNMVQTIGSAGESLAAGVIFTVPAMVLIAREAGEPIPGTWKIFMVACMGGILGVLFMIPLRRFLIVREHERLPFPEGTACAEVQVAGQQGGEAARMVFKGLIVGAIYKLVMYFGKAGKLLTDEVEAHLPLMPKAVVGSALEASLLAVGFILGPGIAGTMLAGAVVGWLVLIPAIAFLGANAPEAIFPATVPIAQMAAGDIWSKYIRYIGAGAVAFGGVLSLVKALPMIWSTLTSGILSGAGKGSAERTERDLDTRWVLGGIAAAGAIIYISPVFEVSVLGTICTVFFAFFFTTVSARIVGIVGSSSNPASGMTIATLLATSLVFVQVGFTGTAGMLAAITVGAVVCIGICIGGDTSQDLKTGWLVGATPWKQQVGELLGVLAAAPFLGYTLWVLDNAFKLGSSELPAPQANLMKLVVQGVMQGDLPWEFVLMGAAMGLAIELLGIGCLPFAVGLYLPFSLSAPIMVGGILRWVFDATLKAPEREEKAETGVLLASGLIAGEASMGVMVAAGISLMEYLRSTAPATAASISQVVWGWTEGRTSAEPSQLWSLAVFGVLVFLFVDLYLSRWPRPEAK